MTEPLKLPFFGPPIRAKDPTGTARQQRYRDRRKAAADPDTVMLGKAEMRGIAKSLVRGEACRLDMLMAAALIVHLMRDVPEDGEVRINLGR